jgi:pyruvate dehydrogenase E2 component (dihydrolipoamide acetyltransferase)
MAVGAGRRVARPGAGGAPELRTLMTVTLSADQRVYDGEVASAFLGAFSRAMANPYRLYQS